MLIVSDLAVRYGMHEALTSISVQIATDEIVVMLGANGAGKSTLLKAISGVCEGNVEGFISLNGESLTDLDAAQIVARGLAFVPEGRGIFGDLSVQENLQLGSYTEHARQHERENLDKVLSLFPKLEERKNQIARTMSGGEQQMVAIGRALMSAPSVLMLDEPSLGLSPLLCKELFQSLQQVRDSGVGILLVEQNAKQSLSIANRGYLLGNGSIVGQGSAQKLLNDPMVQSAYLGGAIASQSSIAKSVPPVQVSPESDAFMLVKPEKKINTPSSNTLIGEDIDAIVARASDLAGGQRSIESDPLSMHLAHQANLPKPANTAVKTQAKRLVPESVSGVLPATQDTDVQRLLTEFETAARNAASYTKPLHRSTGLVELSGSTENLPVIPVYKKSSVTVYRRDSKGTLRKQEKL